MESHKVLIIDDEKGFCSLLEEFLSEEGYSVDFAYDGEEGIKKTKTFAPDIILLDYRMPNMDGIQVIKKVREFCSTPIICVSAVASKEVIDECIRFGANRYLFKPIDLDDMLAGIESALK